jgi:hypothetical protein
VGAGCGGPGCFIPVTGMGKQNIGEGSGSLHVTTLNVRGMSDRIKRQRLFTFFKSRCKGIMFLQETYTLPGDEKSWESEWGGNVFLSHGSRHSCGVAVLIPKQYDCDIKEVTLSDNGRHIVLRGTFNGNKLTLLNYYAPTADKIMEQQRQLEQILPIIHNNFSELIWGGDMNMTLNPELDKYGKTENKSKYVTKILQILQEYNLCDIWRLMHPDRKRYTWRKSTPKGIQQSRLDYLIIPQNLTTHIEKCEIEIGMYTDHSIVAMEINGEQANIRGKGFWKMNTSLLKDTEYVQLINETIENSIKENNKLTNKGLKWDFIKMKIRTSTISHATHKAKCKREHEDRLNKEIRETQNQLNNEDAKARYDTVIRELEQINNERTRGAQVRAKCTHLEFNEQNSKYFFNKEEAAAKTKNMRRLIDEKGQTYNTPQTIMEHTKQFYQNLYKQDNKHIDETLEQAEQYFLTDNDIATIQEQDKNALDHPITLEEIAKAVKDLPNNKTPGSDGLPVEFYKMFWGKIQEIVYESIIYAIEIGEMSMDQKRGVLTLIPKKDKDIKSLKNWRPLSLLNTDYKILAKALAARLQSTIGQIVSTDQSGCIKGRSTFSNIRSTLDIISYTEEQNLPGILTFVDYEKAFDTVNHNFMMKCLENMNFGQYFRHCIETLYEKIETCVTNNGHFSEFFKPTRGIRQGCPISANIFILIVEHLANVIRSNPNIKGIRINGIEYKISQYADDTCLYLSDQNSLQEALNTIKSFTTCSGLKINMDKSEAMWIGATSNYRHKPYKLRWTQDMIKSLGLYIGTDQRKMTEKNFEDRLDKIQNLADLWCLRKLTLKGKILVANTLLMPIMIYPCSVIDTPLWVITKYKEIVMKFIWGGKPPKVKYSAIINDIPNGGLKLQDLQTKVRSLHLQWIQNINNPSYKAAWKEYVATKFTKKNSTETIVEYNTEYNDFPQYKDNFYNSIFKTWATLHNREPITAEQVLKEIIWNNSYIKVDKKTVYYENWKQKGITHVKDLLNNKGDIMTRQEVTANTDIQLTPLQYEMLISAIPTKWKKLLKSNRTTNNDHNVKTECTIIINKTTRQIKDIKTKDIYWHLLMKMTKRPTSENKWKEKTDLDLTEEEWATIYTLNQQLTRDTQILNFQFKITHRLLACGYNLQIWKIKEDNLCEQCNHHEDTIEHFLVLCQPVREFWRQVINWWTANLKVIFRLETYEILFGIPNDERDTIINQFNFILLMGRHHIYKRKKAGQKPDLYILLVDCKNHLMLEHKIMAEKSESDKLKKKWNKLYENL